MASPKNVKLLVVFAERLGITVGIVRLWKTSLMILIEPHRTTANYSMKE
jgi:hypothetical protein